MRAAVLAAVLSAGCFSSGARPAVAHRLDQQPQDYDRDATLDSSRARPEPEMRKGMTKKENDFELGAAVGAAILGDMFSSTNNADVVLEHPFDETGQIKPKRVHVETDAPPSPPPAEDVDAGALVPWIQVGPASPAPNP